MLFNSYTFLVFFAVVLVAWHTIPRRWRTGFGLAASYVFYGAWDARYLTLIAISTVVDYIVALRLEATEDERARKRWLTLSVATNLGILGFFKYADFFVESFAELLGWFGVDASLPLLEVVLPVGISFYTFQTLSYTIDVYRRRLSPTHDFWAFAQYVAFFPQLVAGPIERASRLLPQIERGGDRPDFGSGIWLFARGMFKKVVIADQLARIVDIAYAPDASPGGFAVLIATYAFAYQIYCDFSGYTDIARGVARMLGFELMENFRRPYLATDPSDFWRRWHISLSTWLRDYLYIPLGGNRGGRINTYRNLAITMLLGGLWHGAAWNFVLWGAYHGALLAAHRWLRERSSREDQGATGRLRRSLHVIGMFHLTCYGWLLFRAVSFEQIAGMTTALFAEPWAIGTRELGWALVVAVYTPWVWLLSATSDTGPWRAAVQGATRSWMPVVRYGVAVALLVAGVLLFAPPTAASFIYFQF